MGREQSWNNGKKGDENFFIIEVDQSNRDWEGKAISKKCINFFSLCTPLNANMKMIKNNF